MIICNSHIFCYHEFVEIAADHAKCLGQFFSKMLIIGADDQGLINKSQLSLLDFGPKGLLTIQLWRNKKRTNLEGNLK